MSVSTQAAGIPAELVNIIQDRTLERMFHDALYPRLLFRAEARPEVWPVNLGERMAFTRRGLIPVSTTALTPGADPSPSTYAMEQWEAEARQFGDSIDTHMPSSYVTLASLFLSDTATLGLNAGETLNRLTRNALYSAYLTGDTATTAAAAISDIVIQVASINGFTEQLVNGRPTPVGPANPLAISFSGAEPDNFVVGAAPADPANPLGPGTLTLQSALTAGVAAREGVQADTRARKLRVGGGATVDAIGAADILTVADVRNAVARLRAAKVPPQSDGYYHVHCSPEAESQLFDDNEFQRLFQSLPDSMAYRDLAIGQLLGCRFYRNTETPNRDNVGALSSTGVALAQAGVETGADVINETGVEIDRTIVVGGGAVYEKYLDESKFITDAGVTGKIGEFSVVNGGVQVMTSRIRYILRSPLDRMQQVVSQTWSWSGDFPVPSDATTGNAARYKRAIVIEHAKV